MVSFTLLRACVFIQSMSAVTAEVTEQMMQQWRGQIHGSEEESAEIDMIHAFNDLTSKVNGRVAFGTSHREVEEVIVLMREMQKLATAATLDAPILWYGTLSSSPSSRCKWRSNLFFLFVSFV